MDSKSSQNPELSNAPPLLLAEALGFSPQLLLDDIINIANNAVQDGVNGTEKFLQKWADEREERLGGEWDSNQEVEQGLVAFQTLLEYHTDIAFDFFEAWSLRNIFAIPPDLPVVLPHQQDLDLTSTPEREQELLEELQRLRDQIDNQRRLRRLFTRAIRACRAQRMQAEKRLERLDILQSPTMDILAELPTKLRFMHESVSNLPPMDSSTVSALLQLQMADPGKRQWETSKTGYLNWAVSQLLAKSKRGEGGTTAVDDMERRFSEVGQTEDLKRAFEAAEGVRADLDHVEDRSPDDSMDTSS